MIQPMIQRMIQPTRVLLCLLIVVAVIGESAAAPSAQTLDVFFVRHAEKQLDGRDPALTEVGVSRAEALALLLRDAGIQEIHSSDYRRTRDTAAPLAATLGLEVQLYDPRDMAALVEVLRQRGGRHLVVGHSNTTPAGVRLLGGREGEAIEEATEYDRLYYVSVCGDGQVRTVLLRY
jgi:2,3-bisphosphoglycerate-dependent phosphoglycerate mutase